MSLAGQISDIVTALAATQAARRAALSGIRSDTARHLDEARSAHRRMASAQQHSLSEALRSTKLATAILLGAADEQIDGYRKARIEQAASLDRELSDGANALRSNTRNWIGTQSAMRRKQAADNLRQRRRDRDALASDVRALTEQNLSHLAALTKDRREAAAIWLRRNGSAVTVILAAAPVKSEAPARMEAKPEPEPVKAEAAKPEPVKPEPVKAEPAKPEPAKMEPVKAEAARSEAKREPKAETRPEGRTTLKADKPETDKSV